MKSLFAAIVVFVGFTGLAAAQAPVAVVEDVQGKVTGAEFMDYVAPGTVIKLGPAGKVVLSYMKSCWRETITGVGTVIVGAEDSMVHLSEVKAGKVQCDSGHSQLVDRQVRESAATVVRSIGDDVSMMPQVTLYGLSPVVETTGRGKLVVERLDVAGGAVCVELIRASVVVIALDEESSEPPPFQGSPTLTWTTEIGRVLSAVIDGGAKVVGFDIVFPRSIEQSELPFGDDLLGARMRGFDRAFLRSLAKGAAAGKVVLGETLSGEGPSPGQRIAVGQQ